MSAPVLTSVDNRHQEENHADSDLTNVILVQELVEHGPQGYETVYGTSYVTRVVCTSQESADQQLTVLTENDLNATFLLLKVPLDKAFPKGLPPGAEPPVRPPYRMTQNSMQNDSYDMDIVAEAHILEHLQVPASTYERDRKIREAEMRQRLNVRPIPAERPRHPVT